MHRFDDGPRPDLRILVESQQKESRRRPVLVLSQDVFNERSGRIIAITCQPQRAGFPLSLDLPARRLPKRSWVKISQIRTLAVERLAARLGRATREELAQVLDGLLEIVGA